jgi:hypothetical protein
MWAVVFGALCCPVSAVGQWPTLLLFASSAQLQAPPEHSGAECSGGACSGSQGCYNSNYVCESLGGTGRQQCSGTNSCVASKFNCENMDTCELSCEGNLSCRSMSTTNQFLVRCRNSEVCAVTCDGISACRNVDTAGIRVQGEVSKSLAMSCLADHACEYGQFLCPSQGPCSLTCGNMGGGKHTCRYAKIYVSTQADDVTLMHPFSLDCIGNSACGLSQGSTSALEVRSGVGEVLWWSVGGSGSGDWPQMPCFSTNKPWLCPVRLSTRFALPEPACSGLLQLA